jgi:hypothetical protein
MKSCVHLWNSIKIKLSYLDHTRWFIWKIMDDGNSHIKEVRHPNFIYWFPSIGYKCILKSQDSAYYFKIIFISSQAAIMFSRNYLWISIEKVLLCFYWEIRLRVQYFISKVESDIYLIIVKCIMEDLEYYTNFTWKILLCWSISVNITDISVIVCLCR